MEFLHRHQQSENRPEQHPLFQTGGGDAPADTGTERTVLCQHGVLNADAPVAGMTVGEAREMLNSVLRIDPDAVAVINGEVVPDDHVIGEDVSMLNFTKQSYVKG